MREYKDRRSDDDTAIKLWKGARKRAGERVQWTECLPCKHEDLSLISRSQVYKRCGGGELL